MSSIFPFGIISVVVTEPKISLCILPSAAAAAAAVNPTGVKTFLINGAQFSLTVNQFLIIDREVYQRVPLIALF